MGTVSPSFSLIVNLTFLIFTAITALTLMSDITADHLDIITITITITADYLEISPIAILGNPEIANIQVTTEKIGNIKAKKLPLSQPATSRAFR